MQIYAKGEEEFGDYRWTGYCANQTFGPTKKTIVDISFRTRIWELWEEFACFLQVSHISQSPCGDIDKQRYFRKLLCANERMWPQQSCESNAQTGFLCLRRTKLRGFLKVIAWKSSHLGPSSTPKPSLQWHLLLRITLQRLYILSFSHHGGKEIMSRLASFCRLQDFQGTKW